MDPPTRPLDYAPQPPPPRSLPLLAVAYLCLAVLIGGIYSVVADFRVYMGLGPTAWPKFELPLAWRLAESAVVGAVGAVVILIGAGLIRRWYRAHR